MTDVQRSAEKDLLKLIENPGGVEAQKQAFESVRPAKKSSSARPAFPLLALFKKAGDPKIKAGSEASKTGGLTADRSVAIKVLAILTVGVLVFFIMTVFSERSKLEKTKNFEKFNYIFEGKEQVPAASKDEVTLQATVSEEKEPPLRNIFKPWAMRKEEEDVAGTGASLSAIKDFKLVGISIAEDPKDSYAMAENTKTGITFFLKKGEKLAGMELLEITDNKLVFKEGGKSVELR